MTTATDEYIFDCRGSGVELLFIRYSSGRYQFNIGADIGWLSNSGVTIGTNTWIHFALVRQSNGDVKIYRDGVDHNSSGVNQINSGIMNDNTNLASTDFWISATRQDTPQTFQWPQHHLSMTPILYCCCTVTALIILQYSVMTTEP